MQQFDFGENWQNFSKEALNPEKIEQAVEDLEKLLERTGGEKLTLSHKSFLDVGCGTGLMSLAAAKLGAGPIVGVDINPKCVQLAQRHFAKIKNPGVSGEFRLGSALDSEFVSALGSFDIVYAWGSLHHTGQMWKAIGEVTRTVRPGGVLVLAIYQTHWTTPTWKKIKWLYNQLPKLGQKVMAAGFAGVIAVAKFAVTRKNPFEKERGMSFWYDVVDWVGGYPYETATQPEMINKMNEMGFSLIRSIPPVTPIGCCEYVFQKQES